MTGHPRSFYFFDFDKNIMTVQVPMVLTNTRDQSHRELSAHDYGEIKDQLGKPGEWQDWSDSDLFLNYRDRPGLTPAEQPFACQIRNAIQQRDPTAWQAPAWGMFVHACNCGDSVSLITARGHAEASVRAGFEVLKDAGWIQRAPNFLTIDSVTCPATMQALGDPEGKLPVEQLKRIAVMRTVDQAVCEFGDLPHHFGMSDDTMGNVEACADAMTSCKQKYPQMRFFMIATNAQHRWKAEFFPANVPVAGHGDPAGPAPLEPSTGW